MIRWVGLLISILLAGCNSLRVGDLRQGFMEPAYIRRIEAGEHLVEVRYIPRVLRMITRSGLDDSAMISRSLLDSLRLDPQEKGLLFLISVGSKGDGDSSGMSRDVIYGNSTGFSGYREALSAFQFGFKEKIWLESGPTRYPPGHYHMVNTFGMTPGRTLVVSFSQIPESFESGRTPFSLVLDDLVPGMSRRKLEWSLPVGTYDEKI